HSSSIDVRIIAFDLFIILFSNLIKCAFPKIERVGEHICFAAKCQLLVFIALASVIEGIPEAALNSAAGVDAFLQGAFVWVPFENKPACAGVKTFVVFANDDEIDVLWFLIFQRTKALVVQLHWPQIDVLLQLKTGAEEDAFFQNSGLHVG